MITNTISFSRTEELITKIIDIKHPEAIGVLKVALIKHYKSYNYNQLQEIYKELL
jgi:hypothetical protein